MQRFWMVGLIFLLAGNGWAQSKSPEPLRVGLVDSMVKVPLEKEPLEGSTVAEKAISWDAPIHIELAKNEFENAQIVLTSPSGKSLQDVRIEVGELVQNEKTSWPQKNIALWQVNHVEMYNLWGNHERMGWFPDPMTPISAPLTISGGQNQSVLVAFHATETMPAGVYRGSLTIRAAEVPPVTTPMEVTVWDFAVPKQQHFTLAIPIWGAQMETMYGKELTPEQKRAYLTMLLDHRVAPFPLTDEETTFCFDRGMRDFNLVCYPKDFMPDDARQRVETPYETLQKHPWSAQAQSYVLLGDECPPEDYPFLKAQGRTVREVSPKIERRFTLSMENTSKGFDFAFKEIQNSADTVILSAAPCYPVQETTELARKYGFNVWWYYVAAHYYIPTEGLNARQIFWQHWKFKIPGQLHWGMSYWGDANIAGKDGKKWPEIPWDTKDCRGGDGYLTYPAAGGGVYLPSQRLELLRDGIEDYEYFWLLNDLTPKLAEHKNETAIQQVAENQRLLDIPNSLIQSYKNYCGQPQEYRAYRQKLAEAIVRTQNLLRDGTH